MSDEGHDVHVFIQDVRYSPAGLGLVTRVAAWRPVLNESDLVVCATEGFGQHAKVLRGNGRPVFGCNRTTDMLERDEDKQKEFLTICGLGEGPERANGHEPLEMSLVSLFNGHSWLTPSMFSFESTKLFPGDLGPNVRSMGTVLTVARRSNPITKRCLNAVEKPLSKLGYKGFVEFNLMVGPDYIDVTGLTMHPTMDVIYAMYEGLKEPITNVLFGVAASVQQRLELSNDYLISIRASLPPWPFTSIVEGKPIALDIAEGALKHLYFNNVQKNAQNYYYMPSDGVLLNSCAIGRDVQEARRRAYRTLRGLDVDSLQYREDIGTRVPTAMTKLREYNYL